MRNWTKAEQKNRSNACKTLTVLSQELFFFSLWSISAELSDTSSAVLTRHSRALIEVGLSHPCSPMILLSMGQWKLGEPPWVYSIGGIAICLLPSHWEDVRLKLFYAWLNSLFCITPPSLFFSSLFLSLLYLSPNPAILKIPHAARREESICYSGKLPWIVWRSCSWIGILFSLELNSVWKWLFFCLKMHWMCFPNRCAEMPCCACFVKNWFNSRHFNHKTPHHSDLKPTSCFLFCKNCDKCSVFIFLVHCITTLLYCSCLLHLNRVLVTFMLQKL